MSGLAFKIAFLSLGSNVGAREENLKAALDLLAADDVRLCRVSPVYETEPVDLPGQRWFLNLVAEVETTLFPVQFLERVLSIERKMGRRRMVPKGPRTIDIDIVFFGKSVIKSARLEVPHPRFRERRFVLAPLADLAPEFRDPVTRRTVRELLGAAGKQAVRKLDFQPT